jgi:hypothetical protein
MAIIIYAFAMLIGATLIRRLATLWFAVVPGAIFFARHRQ